MGRHVIFPVTVQDREALGIADEFEDEKTIGICVSTARVREGFKRWEREARPSPFEHPDASDAIQTLSKRDVALEEQYQEKLQQTMTELEAAADAALDAKDEQIYTLTTENGLYKTRVEVKDNTITTLESENKAYDKASKAYKGRYGRVPIAPMSGFQRFVARLFRIC